MVSFASLRLERLRPLRKPSVWLLRALAPIVATIAIAKIPWMRGKYGDFPASAAWGLVLLASYAGWGRLVGSRCYPDRKLGLGLECALGMALSIAVGGALMLVHLARGPAIIGWTIGGLVALLVEAIRAPIPRPRRQWLTMLRRRSRLWTFAGCMVVFAGLLLVRYFGSVANLDFNKIDDNLALRGFARQILDAGTLFQPFSLHRIASLGGQSYLDAMALARANGARLHMIDEGLCVLVVGALVTGYEGVRRSTRTAILLALVLLVTLPHRSNDIQSQMSGVVFFLAIFRVLDSERFVVARSRSSAIVLGLLAAAACTLRASYVAACGAFLVFHYVSLVVASRGERKRWLYEGCAVALATIAFLTPWATLAYESARTFFYPVMRGTTNPVFGVVAGKVTVFEELRWILKNVLFCWPIRTIPVFAVGALIIGYRAKTRALNAMLFGTFVGFGVLVHFLHAPEGVESPARDYFAFMVAFALAATLKAVGEPISRRRGVSMAFVLVAASVALQVIEVRDKTVELYNASLTNIEEDAKNRLRWNDMAWLKADDLANRMQASVPAAARILVMTEQPFRFDGARNPIWTFEPAGAVSPRPGLPYFKGPEAMVDYLARLGVRHVAFRPMDQSGVAKERSQYYVDAFETLQQLATTRRVLFHDGDYWVLDLQTPAPPP